MAIGLATLATLAVIGGCSGQGEGERCDHRAANNGDSDCQNGLTCQNPASNIAVSPYGVCCPEDLALAKTSACSANSGLIDANPAPPDATAGGDATGGDATASGEAGADAADEAVEGVDGPTE